VGRDPLVIRFLCGRITYVRRLGRKEKPTSSESLSIMLKRTQQNPYGLVVNAIEQTELVPPREKPTDSTKAP
jgi:hypothetical protein